MKKYFKQIFIISIILSFTFIYNLQSAFAQNQPHLITSHGKIPNFAQFPTILSAQNGLWSDPNTWSPARLPAAGDVILINHMVTYGNTSGEAKTIGIDVGGILKFKNDTNTRLKVGTLLVMPGGTLEVGTEQSPIQSQVTAEIIIAISL
ncbi:MAG: G8 domain-containing protein [Candidatus Scalinduaceae bacterium]